MIFRKDQVLGANLHVGAIYEGDQSLATEPLSVLLGVANMGGIRPKKDSIGNRAFVALFTTGNESEWPDYIDSRTGIATYYGDNRKPQDDLHKPNGNKALRDIFNLDFRNADSRSLCPPFFLFTSIDGGAPRSMRFDGLAVPGAPIPETDWCTAKFFTSGTEKYQNYEIKLTILAEPVISQLWIADLVEGNNASTHCPVWFADWRTTGRRVPLTSQ